MALGYPVVTPSVQRNILLLVGCNDAPESIQDARWPRQGEAIMNTTALYLQPKWAARTVLAGTVLALTVSLNGCSRGEALPKAVVQSFEQAFNADDLDGCLALRSRSSAYH